MPPQKFAARISQGPRQDSPASPARSWPSADAESNALSERSESKGVRRALEIAYRLLAVRMRSQWELTERLQRREIPPETIDEVLSALSQRGLVDDAKFAEAWVRGRLALRPSGAVRLRHELMRKGVSREIIGRAVAAVMAEHGESELDLALAVARSRGSRYRGLPPEVACRRLSALLQRRGFSAEVIAKTIRSMTPP